MGRKRGKKSRFKSEKDREGESIWILIFKRILYLHNILLSDEGDETLSAQAKCYKRVFTLVFSTNKNTARVVGARATSYSKQDQTVTSNVLTWLGFQCHLWVSTMWEGWCQFLHKPKLASYSGIFTSTPETCAIHRQQHLDYTKSTTEDLKIGSHRQSNTRISACMPTLQGFAHAKPEYNPEPCYYLM